MNLIWSESDQWLLSYGVRKIPGAFLMPMGMPMMPEWACDHDVAQLEAKTVQMNLISSESDQWLLSYGVRKIPGAFLMPMGMPMMPEWACDHDVAQLEVKTVQMNLVWSESDQWLQSYGVRKIPGAFLMPMGIPMMPEWGM